MTQRPLPTPPEPPQCQVAFEQLPWLVNGSLSATEARELQAHAAGCPLCRGRLSVERELYAGIRRPSGNVQQTPLAAWARFESALTATPASLPASPPMTETPAPAQGRAAPPASMPPAPAAPALPAVIRRPHPLRITVTLQAAAIALLSMALLWTLVARAPLAPQPAYRTVSTTDTTLPGDGVAWRVEFDAAIPHAEVVSRLAAQGLRVRAGPSTDGVYTVAPLEGAVPRIDALRADPSVRLVEPLGPAAAVGTPAGRGR